MNGNDAVADWVVEALAPLGPVRARRMFGGVGLSLEGLTFAIAAFDELYLKADAETAPRFEAQGLKRFTIEMKGKPASMNYYRPPEECMDDAEALRDWAELAIGAARRAAAAKPVRRRKRAA